MSVYIESFIHRCKRRMSRLSGPTSEDNWQTEESENVIAIYRNDCGKDVAFTTHRLRWWGNSVSYTDIKETNIDETKTDAKTIHLINHDGENFEVTIDGGEGKLRDVWEILHLLDKIQQSIKKQV